MNFYKLRKLLEEAGYDSQVIPGGVTVSQQPMQSQVQMQPQPMTQNIEPNDQNQPEESNNLIQDLSSKLGEKYVALLDYLKNQPEMLELFLQALEDASANQSLNQDQGSEDQQKNQNSGDQQKQDTSV